MVLRVSIHLPPTLISLRSTSLSGELSFSNEYGLAQVRLCVTWVMDLTLCHPGFDFVSTPGFWLCIDPIPPHHLGVLHCLHILFSKVFHFFLCMSDLKSPCQLTFFQPRLCLLSLRSTTFFPSLDYLFPSTLDYLFFGKYFFLWCVWTAQARLCIAWVMD